MDDKEDVKISFNQVMKILQKHYSDHCIDRWRESHAVSLVIADIHKTFSKEAKK